MTQTSQYSIGIWVPLHNTEHGVATGLQRPNDLMDALLKYIGCRSWPTIAQNFSCNDIWRMAGDELQVEMDMVSHAVSRSMKSDKRMMGSAMMSASGWSGSASPPHR